MAEEIPEKTDEQTETETEDASRQDLIDRTQARLDKVAGIESDEDVSDDRSEDESTDEDEQSEDESTDESVDEDKDVDGDEDKPEETAEVGDKKSTEPTLPDAYRRSLKAYDWTDEEITQAFEAAPDKFLETAERIHRNRNVETAGYAEAGRRVRQQTGVTEEGKPEVPQAVKTVDAEALTKEYGNEELVNAIVSPVNEVIGQINKILPELEQSKKDAEQSRVEVLGQQIETFFTAKGLKPYTEVYGDVTKAALTETQQKNRNKVLEQADAVIIGAKLQGRQLTVEEGLLMAHDSVAGEFKEQVIRKELKKKTKKRAKSVSVKPSHHGKPSTDGKPTTRKQLEAKVTTGLKAIFGS